MKGWKTWAGAGLIAVSAVLEYLGNAEAGAAVLTLGAALGLVGIGHKVEKNTRRAYD